MPNTTVHKQLLALRKSQRLTQAQMAERMSVEERTYRSWEKGKTSPTVYHLQLLAESFGRSLTDLLQVDPESGDFPPPAPPEPASVTNHLMVALLEHPGIPSAIKNLILNVIRKVLRGGGGRMSG